MKVEPTQIPDVMRLTPRRFTDARGYFMETFRLSLFEEVIDGSVNFVQTNQSVSVKKDTIRGLHYQSPPHAQGKLVRCVKGSILDVAVDVRQGSPNYGQSITVELSAENDHQLWIPAGFLHGFRTIEDNSIVTYQCTAAYASACEGTILWNDTDLKIDWGIESPASISERDSRALPFADFKTPFHFEASE